MTSRPSAANSSSSDIVPSALQKAGGRNGGMMSDETSSLLRIVTGVAQISVLELSIESYTVETLTSGGSGELPYGLNQAQVARGVLWTDNLYPADRDRLRTHLERWDVPRAHPSVDYRLIVGDGELLWVRHWVVGHTRGPDGRGTIRSVLMPIPEQKHLEWECLHASERECNRVGQELHDDLCQVLAGVTFMMRLVGERARRLDPALAAEVEELNTQLVGATDRVRSMAHGLFPAQLNYAKLKDALAACVADCQTRFRVKLTLQVPAQLPNHSADQIIHIYRIVQEAISNAVKHGEATVITVVVTVTSGGISVLVTDNGRGFSPETGCPEGIGLHVMQYRAHMLGGTLELNRISPHGVAAKLSYPTTVAEAAQKPHNTPKP